MKRGIVVAFPGTGYTCKERLFADCMEVYTSQGYDCVALDYSSVPFKRIETLEEALRQAQAIVLEQLHGICFSEYENAVFLSKSLGTAMAGWCAAYYGITPRQFYLTPILQALPFIGDPRQVIGMVIGTDDRVLDHHVIAAFCDERGIPCMVVAGVGHDLKYQDTAMTDSLNERIVAMCRDR